MKTNIIPEYSRVYLDPTHPRRHTFPFVSLISSHLPRSLELARRVPLACSTDTLHIDSMSFGPSYASFLHKIIVTLQLLPFTQKVFAIEFINSIIGVAVIFKLNKSKALQNQCSISTHFVLMTILQKNCGESLTCLIRTSVLRPYPLKNLSKSFSLNGKNDVMPSVKYHLSSMDITVVQDRQKNIPAIWGQVPNVDSAAP